MKLVDQRNLLFLQQTIHHQTPDLCNICLDCGLFEYSMNVSSLKHLLNSLQCYLLISNYSDISKIQSKLSVSI